MTVPASLSDVPDVTPYIQYVATNGQTVFPYPFPITQDADLVVIANGVTLATDAGYTVSGVGNDTGGNITFTVGRTTGDIITLFRDISIERLTQIAQNSGYSSALFNFEYNNIYLILQQLENSISRCLQVPNTNSPAPTTILTPGAYANMYLAFDANGNPTPAALTSSGSLTQAIISNLLAPQSAAEATAGITPTSTFYPVGWVLRYGTNSVPGTTDMTAAFNSAVKLGWVFVPPGSYKVTNVAISTNDCTMVGGGRDNTVLTVGANNSNIFNVTGQRFKVSDIKFVGDGTSSSSANGSAVFLTNAGEHINIDCSYTGFGFGCIGGTASSALQGPRIIRPKFRATAALGTDVNLGGIWTDTLLDSVDAQSATADRVLLMYDNSTTGWQGVTVRGGVANGYLKQQFATTDEHWDGSNRVWTALFDGVRCIGSNWSGIKCKTSRNVKIVNCTFDGCGLAQEDQPSGLYGDVLVNSLGKVLIQGNTFRNSGSAAIKCNATAVNQYPGANPGGLAEDLWTIEGNLIETTGVVFAGTGYGIAVSNGWKGMLIRGNIMRGIAGCGIITLTSAASPFWDLGIFDNTITDCPAASTGMNLGFGQSLRMNGNFIQNGPAAGVTISTVDYIDIGPEDTVLDPAAGSGRGYQIGTFKNLNFRARSGNSTYTAWTGGSTPYTVGQRVFNGPNVYECVVGGTGGVGAGPVATSGADTSDGTVTWWFSGKYQLMPYALRIVGTNNGRINADFDPTGCITGPIELLQTTASGSVIHYVTAGQTVNATPTNIAQVVPIPDLSAWMCEMRATACITGAPTDRAAYNIVGLFYRNGGVTTLQGALTNVVTIESNAAWDAKPVVSASSIAPGQVTGAAVTTIDWVVDVTLRGIA
jgi:hypothetical protein